MNESYLVGILVVSLLIKFAVGFVAIKSEESATLQSRWGFFWQSILSIIGILLLTAVPRFSGVLGVVAIVFIASIVCYFLQLKIIYHWSQASVTRLREAGKSKLLAYWFASPIVGNLVMLVLFFLPPDPAAKENAEKAAAAVQEQAEKEAAEQEALRQRAADHKQGGFEKHNTVVEVYKGIEIREYANDYYVSGDNQPYFSIETAKAIIDRDYK